MIKNLIKVDYILSSWFSNTHNKLIPGTAFLFLNKVVFLWVSIFFFSTSFSQKEINIEIYVSVRLLFNIYNCCFVQSISTSSRGWKIRLQSTNKKINRMIKEFENGILTANGAALGKLKNVSLNDKLYSCDIENLNLSQVPDLEALLKSYNSAFLDISLMLK